MKNYYQFINEYRSYGEFNKNIPLDFIFAIDLRKATLLDIGLIFKELEKYVEIEGYAKDYLLNMGKDKNINLPWAWIIEIYESFGNGNMPRITLNFGIVTTPSWGAGVKYMEDIITFEEFLNVGLEGVKEYIEMRSAMKSYNL
jgi:hypothetical protein